MNKDYPTDGEPPKQRKKKNKAAGSRATGYHGEGYMIVNCPGCAFWPIRDIWLKYQCPCGSKICRICETTGCHCANAGEWR